VNTYQRQKSITQFLTALCVSWIKVSLLNYRMLKSQGCIFANSSNIFMQVSQYKKWQRALCLL